MLCFHLLALTQTLVVLELAREHRRVHLAIDLGYALHNLVVDFGVATVGHALLAALEAVVELERLVRVHFFVPLKLVVDRRHTWGHA